MANQQSKNIQYSGLTTLPDDYQSVDGSLAFATNAVYEDNAVKIIPPALAKNLIVQKGDKVYVHSMATYTHYVVVHQSEEGVTLYWVDEKSCEEKKVYCVTDAQVDNGVEKEGDEETGPVFTIGTYAGTFVDLAFVGNTVILSTSESLQYILWKVDDNAYIYLGNGTPKIDIQFGLALSVVLKNYEKADISLTDKQTVSSDDFVVIGSAEIEEQTNKTSNFNPCYFPESLTIEPDVQYQLRYPHPTVVRTCVENTVLFGYEVDGSGNISDSVEQILSTSQKSQPTKFHVSKKYTKLYVEVHPISGTTDRTISTTIYLESSGASSTIEIRQVEDTSENYVAVMGYMNKFVNEYATKKDKFIYPFFVRYAVKAYDGSNLYESVPTLMYPNTGYAPYFDYLASATVTNKKGVGLCAFIADLEYKLLSTISDEWTDVVTGVDVFVSPPIYPYDQGRGYDEDEANFSYKLYDTDEGVDEITKLNYGIGRLDDTSFASDKFQPHNLTEICLEDFSLPSSTSPGALLQIAPFEEEEIKDKIKTTSTFYKIKTIKFDELKELSGEFASIDMEKDTLNALEAREAFKEEDVQYDDFAGNSLFVYNNRLHLIGGGQGEAVLPAPVRTGLQNGYYETSSVVYDAFVLIRTDQGTKKATVTDTISAVGFPWFFYPNTNAYELWVRYRNSSNVTDWYVSQLETHDFLNGSYYFPGPEFLCENYGSTVTPDGVLTPTNSAPSYGNTILINNKIYVSEASNPFVFKNEMVSTAGSGQVLALSSAAKALSQGQFGQFPLYAFTDEGIWAMSVGSTGAYETVQPIARDVVPTDAVKAITQLDSAVVFVTNRGVMLIEGSNVVCMSDDIDGDFGQFDPRTLSDFYDIMKKHLDFSTDDTDNTIGKWASQAFFDFIRSCQMKYDYVHQRITMYSDDCDIAYVYSLKSKQWLMQLTALQDNVNSYPDAYALRNLSEQVGGVDCTELVNLSEYDLEAERRPMVFVTRPFKLDAPDTFKTVNDIIQRGYFRQDEKINHIIGVSLYGSPDLFNWFLIKNNVGHRMQNLHGSPYKYFRVLVVSQLDAKEGISGCSVWFEPKDTQRLR